MRGTTDGHPVSARRLTAPSPPVYIVHPAIAVAKFGKKGRVDAGLSAVQKEKQPAQLIFMLNDSDLPKQVRRAALKKVLSMVETHPYLFFNILAGKLSGWDASSTKMVETGLKRTVKAMASNDGAASLPPPTHVRDTIPALGSAYAVAVQNAAKTLAKKMDTLNYWQLVIVYASHSDADTRKKACTQLIEVAEGNGWYALLEQLDISAFPELREKRNGAVETAKSVHIQSLIQKGEYDNSHLGDRMLEAAENAIRIHSTARNTEELRGVLNDNRLPDALRTRAGKACCDLLGKKQDTNALHKIITLDCPSEVKVYARARLEQVVHALSPDGHFDGEMRGKYHAAVRKPSPAPSSRRIRRTR